MAKPPKGRHSRAGKDPVTIDLEADKVPRPESDAPPAAGDKATAGATGPVSSPPAEEAAKPSEATATASSPKPGNEKSKPAAASAASASTAASKATASTTASKDPVKSETAAASSPADSSREAPAAEKDAARQADRPGRTSPIGQSSGDSPKTSSPGFEGTAAPPPPGATPAARRGGGLAAGVVGGAIVLGGVLAAQWSGLWPISDDESDGRLATLEAEIGELRQSLAEIQEAGEDETAAARFEGIEGDFQNLRGDVDTLQTELAELSDSEPEQVDLSAIEDRLAALEQGLSEMAGGETEERLSALEDTTAGRMDEIEQRLDGLAQRLEEQAGSANAALVIAVSSLQSAVERGGSFAAELDTLEQLAPETDGLEELRAHAETGVASRSQLMDEMDQAADAMIAADRVPARQDAGFVERLFSSAEGLVAVRPVGEVQGDGVPAIVARIEAAVQADDYERALGEYENLPEASQEAGRAFMDEVRARQAADELVSRVLADAVSESE